MKSRSKGFTLIEVLVVVAVIALLSSVMYANFGKGSAQSRDAKRKADLVLLQSAIELYKNENGRYPVGCKGTNNWSGQKGTSYACTGDNEYIVGLAPKYIKTLPTDPKLNGVDSGYIYATNAEGSVYKLMAKKTVEDETVGIGHQFASCDISTSAGIECSPPSGSSQKCDLAICDTVFTANSYAAQGAKPNQCNSTHTQFQTSYAVWGGYANPTSPTFVYGTAAYTSNVERYTEVIACKI